MNAMYAPDFTTAQSIITMNNIKNFDILKTLWETGESLVSFGDDLRKLYQLQKVGLVLQKH